MAELDSVMHQLQMKLGKYIKKHLGRDPNGKVKVPPGLFLQAGTGKRITKEVFDKFVEYGGKVTVEKPIHTLFIDTEDVMSEIFGSDNLKKCHSIRFGAEVYHTFARAIEIIYHTKNTSLSLVVHYTTVFEDRAKKSREARRKRKEDKRKLEIVTERVAGSLEVNNFIPPVMDSPSRGSHASASGAKAAALAKNDTYLKHWMFAHSDNPTPTPLEKRALVVLSGYTTNELDEWLSKEGESVRVKAQQLKAKRTKEESREERTVVGKRLLREDSGSLRNVRAKVDERI